MDNNQINKAYGKLELVFPTKEYKKEVKEYLQEFLDNGEKEIAGDGGLDRIKDFDKWLEKIQDDLYLDVVVTPTNKIILLDEDELKNAYERLEVNQTDYDMAYTEAKNLMNCLDKNIDKLKMFTDKYLKEMIGDDT